MELSDLEGKHVLNTAAIFSRAKANEYAEEGDALSIGIDGKTYTFIEDPGDGYRSYMSELLVEEGLTAKLRGAAYIHRDVWINYINKGNAGIYDWESHYDSDVIQIVDMDTGHIWAIIGTMNTDDYYPSCHIEWFPMNPDDYKDAVPMREMKEIPITAAQAIADVFGYDQVVIYARRVGQAPHPFGEHMTTYGVTKAHCDVAAKMGDVLKKFMKWDV